MPYLIGTDEAGYAPNLGPLVISATLWEVEEGVDCAGLYKRLVKVVACKPPRRPPGRRVAMADSKLLYKSQQGISLLERGVLAAVGALGHCSNNWRDLWNALAPDSAVDLAAVPWYVDYQATLPLEAEPEVVLRSANMLRRGFEAAGVRLAAIRSRAVFPLQFNELTTRYGSKGEALSQLTLELVAGLLPSLSARSVQIICDKHGGRNYYSRLLQQQFPDYLVESYRESRQESVYRWGPDQQRVECRFCCRAEAFLPAALASMASKYLRELAMRAFNDYWRRLVPDLAPTAGYPGDARRFKDQIAAAQAALGVDDRVLWRER